MFFKTEQNKTVGIYCYNPLYMKALQAYQVSKIIYEDATEIKFKLM